MSIRFIIKLKDVHDSSGKTIYRVAKETGLTYNTVDKYVSTYKEMEKLTPEVVRLAEYYNVDWRDPSIVETIEVDESEGQMETPLIVPA